MRDDARTAGHERAKARDNRTPDEKALDDLADWLLSCQNDPLKFAAEAFPWGEEGTPLENESLEDWQREQLTDIGIKLQESPLEVIIREITLSGHGIGKSADVGILILWAITTYVGAKGIITANTDTQLRTKTMAEVAKWYYMLPQLLQDQWVLTATSIYAKGKQEKLWRVDAIPNSPANPAAFAGAHNAGKRLIVIVDEGSEISDPIYETIEGALTDANTQIIYLVFGNPTSPVGRFKEYAEGRFRHQWKTRRIDSRSVRRTNKKLLADWAKAWGEDSDFFRIRVKGEFPRTGAIQLISTEAVQKARQRDPGYIATDPLILGVDVARYGGDRSVLAPRRGRDAKSIPWRRFNQISTMDLAAQIVLFHREVGFDAIMVDVGGVGAGVYDRLLQLNVPNVYPVDFGSAGGLIEFNRLQFRVSNKRTAIWCSMGEWLNVGAIPDEDVIETDLTGPQYTFKGDNEIQMETKEHMKLVRKLASPDDGDALACTFAYPVQPRRLTHPELPASGSVGPLGGVQGSLTDYDLFADIR